MADWEVWLTTDRGVRLRMLEDNLGFEFVRTVNKVGSFEIVLPPDFEREFMRLDYRVEFWRRPPGGEKMLMFTGLVRAWEYRTDRQGRTLLFLRGTCLKDLLRRRIILKSMGGG